MTGPAGKDALVARVLGLLALCCSSAVWPGRARLELGAVDALLGGRRRGGGVLGATLGGRVAGGGTPDGVGVSAR